jgi:hypothetical protein
MVYSVLWIKYRKFSNHVGVKPGVKDLTDPEGAAGILGMSYSTNMKHIRSSAVQIPVCKSHYLQNGLIGFWNGIAIHSCSNPFKVMPMSFSIALLTITVNGGQTSNSFGTSSVFFGGQISNEVLHRHPHHLLCIEIICSYLTEASQGKKAIRFSMSLDFLSASRAFF